MSDRAKHRRNLLSLRSLAEAFKKHDLESVVTVCVTREPKPRVLFRITEELSVDELARLGNAFSRVASELQMRMQLAARAEIEKRAKATVVEAASASEEAPKSDPIEIQQSESQGSSSQEPTGE